MIIILFAEWISCRIVSLQPDTDIQKLLSNGNQIRISETLFSTFWGFRIFCKKLHIAQSFIYCFPKHLFNILCHDCLCCNPVMESRDMSQDPFLGVSVSKDFGLCLKLFVWRLCIGYFLWSFARSSLKKTVLKNDCSKFSHSKRSVSLLLHCLRVEENNLPSTPFKIYTEFNKKCAHTNETALHNLCKKRLGAGLLCYPWTVFPRVLLWNPDAYSKEVGECQKVSFLRRQIKRNHVFFSKYFPKHSVKTCWLSFSCSA